MLRSLSQAKKECWDRFLHDAQTSELFQEGNFDQRLGWGILNYSPSLISADRIIVYKYCKNSTYIIQLTLIVDYNQFE